MTQTPWRDKSVSYREESLLRRISELKAQRMLLCRLLEGQLGDAVFDLELIKVIRDERFAWQVEDRLVPGDE